MNIRDVFAANVRDYRKKAHLSQEKLAELSGLHRTYIGGIEQRRINVSLKNIGKIATALNVDPAVLFLDNSNHQDQKTPSRKKPAVESCAELKRDEQPTANSAAIVVWTEEGVSFRPVKPFYQDLTVHVLADLIDRGYTGSRLVDRYKAVTSEIDRFLNSTTP